MSRVLFEDVFEILEKDPAGKRFDRVSRFKARSDTYQMDLNLDVNIEIYPLEVSRPKTSAHGHAQMGQSKSPPGIAVRRPFACACPEAQR